MNWTVALDPQVDSFLAQAPNTFRAQFWKRVDRVRVNPLRYIDAYRGEYYKLRFGAYRALVVLDFSKQSMRIVRLGHRSVIYSRQV